MSDKDKQDIEKLIADTMRAMKAPPPGIAMEAGAKLPKEDKNTNVTKTNMPHTSEELEASLKSVRTFPPEMLEKFPEYCKEFMQLVQIVGTFSAAFTALNESYADHKDLPVERRQLLFEAANKLCNNAGNQINRLNICNFKIGEPEASGNMQITTTITLDEDKYPPKEEPK